MDGVTVHRLPVGGADPAWQDWDRFVVAHPDAAFPHLSGHLVALAILYGSRLRAVLAREGDRVLGVLAWLDRGRRPGVSLPFYEYGGPLVAAGAGPEVWAALLAAAGPAEFRMATGWRGPAGLVDRQSFGDFAILPLEAGYDGVLAAADRQVRKAVRKAVREGVRVVENPSAEGLRRQFWPAYRDWMRTRHGTPPLPLAYWEACRTGLGPAWRLFQAWHRSQPVAQLLGFAVGRRVVITTIVSQEEVAGPLRAVDAVHAAMVRAACEEGYEVFDFGAARYEGQRRYKAKWGCQFRDYERLLAPAGRSLPMPATAEGALAGLARAAWRRLPLRWTTALGPGVRARLTL